MLLLTLHRLALRLLPIRTPCAVLTGIGWAALVWVLVSSGSMPGDEDHGLFVRATLAATLCSLLLFAFISLFQTLPTPPLPALKWHERLMLKLRLSLYYLMTFAFLALTLSVLGIAVKLMLLG